MRATPAVALRLLLAYMHVHAGVFVVHACEWDETYICVSLSQLFFSSKAKLLAWTLNQECAIINHLVPALLCDSLGLVIGCCVFDITPCFDTLLRHNVRYVCCLQE